MIDKPHPDYHKLLPERWNKDTASAIEILSNVLPEIWIDEYIKMTPHPVNIIQITINGFEYIFDQYTELEQNGTVPYNPLADDRLIVVYGKSQKQVRVREKSRIKGWLGKTSVAFGINRDKGHFIAHSIGGLADGAEINLFSQNRKLNRGWSEEGRLYRKMENYCLNHIDTWFFHRPIYGDVTNRPPAIEFGVLKSNKELWVEYFSN